MQDAESHKRFAQEYNLNFPLLVDTGRNLSLLLGAADDSNGMSKRITVVVDKQGKISKIDKDDEGYYPGHSELMYAVHW